MNNGELNFAIFCYFLVMLLLKDSTERWYRLSNRLKLNVFADFLCAACLASLTIGHISEHYC